ncbi:MAG: DUF4907 domain-containing protein [Chitinophagaceae bacterium]|nr:DUF4907 domain-containing protein [Chitinophagaceae bacterium]
MKKTNPTTKLIMIFFASGIDSVIILSADKKYLILLLACLFQFQVIHAQQLDPSAQQSGSATQFPSADAFSNTPLTYTIIDAPNNTFCYDIYAEGRLMIHQSSMPGLPGNEGFKTKDDAMKVAEMVMYKIRKGEMPPTVSIDEMKQLGVIPIR